VLVWLVNVILENQGQVPVKKLAKSRTLLLTNVRLENGFLLGAHEAVTQATWMRIRDRYGGISFVGRDGVTVDWISFSTCGLP
jgi:hypothetical protein